MSTTEQVEEQAEAERKRRYALAKQQVAAQIEAQGERMRERLEADWMDRYGKEFDTREEAEHEYVASGAYHQDDGEVWRWMERTDWEDHYTEDAERQIDNEIDQWVAEQEAEEEWRGTSRDAVGSCSPDG